MVGKTISHHEITAKIGEGGMGVVYRARDTKLGRQVALKTLPEQFARNLQRMGRFEWQARVLVSLNHPNIAAIDGLEESDGVQALAMELVEGPMLAYAHEDGAVHRNLRRPRWMQTDLGWEPRGGNP